MFYISYDFIQYNQIWSKDKDINNTIKLKFEANSNNRYKKVVIYNNIVYTEELETIYVINLLKKIFLLLFVIVGYQ